MHVAPMLALVAALTVALGAHRARGASGVPGAPEARAHAVAIPRFPERVPLAALRPPALDSARPGREHLEAYVAAMRATRECPMPVMAGDTARALLTDRAANTFAGGAAPSHGMPVVPASCSNPLGPRR